MTLHGLFVFCVVCVGVCVLMCLCVSCVVVRAMSSGVCFVMVGGCVCLLCWFTCVCVFRV